MRIDPYAHAPRLPVANLPEQSPVDVDALFHAPPEGEPAHRGPVELEIGPGRGWFTIERLEARPDVRVIGFEIRRKWATIVDERIQKRGLGHRGRVFAEDAKLALPRIPSASLSVAYLHFPDPWWKKRHEKRLVMGDVLLEELARTLVPGGELFIQTDVFERADAYEAQVATCPHFTPFEASARIVDHPYVARSPRERKAIEDGLPVVRLRYVRR